MTTRTKLLGMCDVIMRVPPLFIIDEILKISSTAFSASSNLLSPSSEGQLDPLSVNGSHFQPSDPGYIDDDLRFYNVAANTLKFLACSFGCLTAACVFMLWTRHLVIVYCYLTSVGLIFLSYYSNVSALGVLADSPNPIMEVVTLQWSRLLDPGGAFLSILPHLIAQRIMGMIFAYIHLGPKYPLLQKILPYVFLVPPVLGLTPLPVAIVKHSPAVAAILPLVLVKVALWSSAFDVVKTIYNGYNHARNFARNYGLSALVENEWQRLNVPCVLRVFWVIRLLEQLVSLALHSDAPLAFMGTLQGLLVSGSETVTAVLGMTSIVSLLCHYIGKLFQLFLLSEDYEDDKSIGTVSAILFYILALQTGLTSLTPDKRFIRLCRNLGLLVTAVLHFVHNMVAPILMSLSAARNPSVTRHARALTVCLFLVVVPIYLLAELWSRYSPSTWLLAVTAFSVEVIVKVLVSLATYTLFLLDARRQTFWEKLDDYVYYIRVFGNSVEFCFGIFLFLNGAWILLFESAGTVRALMMGIHAYFNIWCEARAGWAIFIKRRTAVHKISSLPEASPDQMRNFDDVCSICYQDMTTAKITRCNHYFHGVCLRKWLYVQDRCPLCHEIIMNPDDGPVTEGGAGGGGGAPVQGAGAVPAAVLAGREDSSSPPASAESNSNNSSSSSNSSSNNHNAGGIAAAAAAAAPSPAPVAEQQSEQHGWEADAATVGFRRREVR